MKNAIGLLIIFVVAIPLTLILTFVLSPFWNWFETVSGIESMGHSGPASWCFIAVFVITLSLGCGAWFLIRSTRD